MKLNAFMACSNTPFSGSLPSCSVFFFGVIFHWIQLTHFLSSCSGSLSLSVSLDGYLLNKIYSLHVIYVALHKQQQTKIFLVTAKRSLPFTNVTELKVFADINKLEVNTSLGWYVCASSAAIRRFVHFCHVHHMCAQVNCYVSSILCHDSREFKPYFWWNVSALTLI